MEDPVNDGIRRIEHLHVGLVLGTTTLGSDGNLNLVTLDHLNVNYGRSIVLGVNTLAGRIDQYGLAQWIGSAGVGTTGTLVYHLLNGHVALKLDFHTDLDEAGYGTGVLTQWSVTDSTHLGVL